MKIATFTFDDGLYQTALKVKALGIPSTFYIVTSWVLQTVKVHDSYNIGVNHGTIEQWKNLNVDLGSHSHNHIKNEINMKESFDYFSSNFDGPYHFSYPYGEVVENEYFNTFKCGFTKHYNDLKDNVISSYNPSENVYEVIRNMPSDKWLVFTMHGIGEGWNPISESEIIKIYKFCIDNDIKVMTMTEVYKNFSLLV